MAGRLLSSLSSGFVVEARKAAAHEESVRGLSPVEAGRHDSIWRLVLGHTLTDHPSHALSNRYRLRATGHDVVSGHQGSVAGYRGVEIELEDIARGRQYSTLLPSLA